MKVSSQDNFVIVKDESKDIDNFIFLLNPLMTSQFKDQNLIIDFIESNDFALEDLSKFKSISNLHRELNKSFVIVSGALNPNELPEDMIVVPTLQEAEDLIEMEEIERELGF